MRNRTSLVLMEQLVMVLVFALAAAVCLQIFVFSERLSKRNAALSQAVLLGQNAAELLKSSGGDVEAVWKDCGQTLQDSGQELSDGWFCRLEINMEKARFARMGSARVSVYGRDGDSAEELLFQIPVAWQEDGGDETE